MKFNLSKAEFALSAGRENQFPRDGRPQIAMSGRSNVGKSSLINTVLGRKKLARTSSEPGKTITVNFYDIDKKSYLAKWHMRFTGIPGRIFFVPNYSKETILICYIGKKLPNPT